MGKGAPLRWLENRILRRHLQGRGIEIGALWRRFPVRPDVRVWYLDRLSQTGLLKDYSELDVKIIAPDIVADAADLPFASGGLDFIIASHVLEHLPLPLASLRKWHETLAPGGMLLLRVPDKRFTFDAPRARTSLEHLIQEMEQPGHYDVWSHYADWVEHIYHAKPSQPHFESSTRNLIESQFSIHYHVWTDEDIHEMIDFTISRWHLSWSPIIFWGAHFYRKEVIALLKKR